MPKTFGGRIVTIVYAIIGIPLMLLCLTNLGKVMADLFKFMYRFTCFKVYLRSRKRKESKQLIVHSQGDKKQRPIFNNRSDHTVIPIAQPTINRDSPEDHIVSLRNCNQNKPTMHSFRMSLSIGNANFMESVHEISEEVDVPIWLPLTILSVYILVGATVFSYLDKWTFFESCYFVFITLTTIGFGDLVPGNFDPGEKSTDQSKSIFCAFYLVTGLAVFAMCFTLIQEKVKEGFEGLAKRIGLI